MSTEQKYKIDNLLQRMDDFPTLPTIYSSLMELTSNPRSTVQDVANLISRDQAISVKLLKVANSTVFGIQTKVDSISQAIFYLGYNEVKNIALSLSIMDIFKKSNSRSDTFVVDLWKHSIAVGVITRLLGVRTGTKNLENYFISGIIHDIGKLFLYKFFKENYINQLSDAFKSDIKASEIERNVYGMNHDEIGSELAKMWKLPVSIRNAIKYHNNGLVGSEPDMLVGCIHLANIISIMLKLGNPGYEASSQPNFNIWKFINLPFGTLKSIYNDIISAYKSNEKILSLK